MKDLNLILPYSSCQHLAKLQIPSHEFLELLIPALELVGDEEIEVLIINMQNIVLSKGAITFYKYNAVDLVIIREYVKRRDLSIEKEAKAAYELAKLREELRKTEAFRGFASTPNEFI
jgi:hypothetical protein